VTLRRLIQTGLGDPRRGAEGNARACDCFGRVDPSDVNEEPAASSKAQRRAERALVGTYHEARLADLLERVRDGFVNYDAGELDAFELDDLIHRYKCATRELWKLWPRRAPMRSPPVSGITTSSPRPQQRRPAAVDEGMPTADRRTRETSRGRSARCFVAARPTG